MDVVILQPRFWLCVLALTIPLGEVQRLGMDVSVLKGVVGLAALSGLAWMAVKGCHLRRSPLDLPLLVFAGALLPSLALSSHESESRWALVSVFGYVVLNIVVANFVRTVRSSRDIAVSLLVGAAAAAILGILQFSTGMTFLEAATGREELYKWDIDPNVDPADPVVRYQRVLGTMRNPNAFASYFVAATPIALALFLSARTRLGEAALLATFLLSALTLVLTFSRGGLVAGIVAVAAVVGLTALSREHRWRIGMVAALVGLGVWLYWPSEANYYVFAFLHPDQDISSEERLSGVWPAIEMFLDHPLLGAGFLESTRLLHRYREALLEGMNIHNNFLAVAAELGLVGLGAFIAIIALTIHSALRTLRSTADPVLRSLLVGYLGAFLGLHVLGLSHMNYVNVQIWFLASLIIATCRIARAPAATSREGKQRDPAWDSVRGRTIARGSNHVRNRGTDL